MAFDATPGPAPRFSAHSSPKLSNYVIGSDFPQWQRDLYPATYQTDAGVVQLKLGQITKQLAFERRCMVAALKAGDHRMVQAYRKQIDTYSRWRRNCETQLRLIEAMALRRAA